MPQVAILMGSDSDMPIVEKSVEMLQKFGVSYKVNIMSAHRTPDLVREYVGKAPSQGVQVFICAAGLAAHLAGVVAAHTTKPVIGLPVDGLMHGLDALLSTVQMPGGIPVATVAVGKAGAKNAGILAVQMLALSDNNLVKKLVNFKVEMADLVKAKNDALA